MTILMTIQWQYNTRLRNSEIDDNNVNFFKHRFNILAETVTIMGQCSLHLFNTLAIILYTSGEWKEASPPGSSLVPNIGTGSVDQIFPLSTTHVLTHLFSSISSTRRFLPDSHWTRQFYFQTNASEKSSEIMTGTFNNVKRRMAIMLHSSLREIM